MVIANLKNIVDQAVTKNVAVQETLKAKQEALDKVDEVQELAQVLVDNLSQSALVKTQEITDLVETKKQEVLDEVEFQAEFVKDVFDENALHRTNQYDANHASKLYAYNENDSIKMAQYNENHIERLENINYAYADRIVEMIRTRNFMGILDEYVAKTATHMITFLDTTDSNYIYYANGTLLTEELDYTVYDSKTIELTLKANPYDVIVQVNTRVLREMLTAEGALFDYMIGQPNGVAGLDYSGKVPAEQLPSYVDDVLEFPTYADLPVEGETGKIYVVVNDETSNLDASTYRWTGTTYAMVSNTLNASDVKALYEENLDTNAYTDAEKSSVDIAVALTTAAQTLPTAINELDTRVADIEDNTTIADYGITDAYTKTEIDGFIDIIDTEIDALVDEVALKAYADNAALTGIPTAPTAGVGTSTEQLATTEYVRNELVMAENRLDILEDVVEEINLIRADKYLASQNVAKMIYGPDGKLSKVRYNNDIDEDYEVLTRNATGKLINVAHYVEGVLRGNTALSYENSKLVSAIYTAV